MKLIKKQIIKLHRFVIFKFSRFTRDSISSNYIKFGKGIEIGAMDLPLKVRSDVKVKYYDRIPREEQKKIFKELDLKKLVKVDLIGDAEKLDNIEADSLDFIIANHFIEHCQNVISTLEIMFSKIKEEGILFLAIPDKRYTFDIDRDITSWKHFKKDYEEGSGQSEYAHYYDFVKHTEHGLGKTDREINEKINELKARNFSIHFHVFDHESILKLFMNLKEEMNFKFEILLAMSAQKYSNESIFILKKSK